jgi:hypothetical protein
MLKNKTYSFLGWWESTKWISWKEFAQTGREKVCDKVKIHQLEGKLVLSKSYFIHFVLSNQPRHEYGFFFSIIY